MKKVISLIVCAMFLCCVPLNVLAIQVSDICVRPLSPRVDSSDSIRLQEALMGEPEFEALAATEGTHVVDVTTPVDEEFRTTYSSWAWEVLRCVDDADDYLGERFNINYNIVSNKYWDSTDGADYGSLLQEAVNEWGLRDGAKLMIAFSGEAPGVGGVAYLEAAYCLIFDQGRSDNTENVQHETGHCYGLSDCERLFCVMGSNYDNLDSFCANHYTEWYNHRLDY